MKSLTIVEMLKLLAQLTFAIVITLHLTTGRLLRDRRTAIEEEGDTNHRHRHQGRLVTVRDYTNGNNNEDYMAPATTRIIARIPGLSSIANERRDADRDDTNNRQEEQGSTDHSTGQVEGSGFTESVNSTNGTIPGHTNCAQCYVRDEMKRLRVEAIKSLILSKLRMKTAPNVTARALPSIPLITRIMEEYEMQRDASYRDSSYDQFGYMRDSYYRGGEDDFHAKTMKVVNFATPVLPANSTTTNKLRFDFSFDILDSTVRRAEFFVYIRPASPPQDLKAQTLLLVYQYLAPKVLHRRTNRTITIPRDPKLIQKERISLASGTGQWHHFDISRTVQTWIKNPRKNLGLKVEIADFQGNPLAIIVPNDDVEELHKPFVEVSVEESNSGRQKREMQGLHCKENDIEKNCCRYPLVVDFEEFKWDWIIAPKNYHANFCSGECPFVFLQKYPHTHLVQQSNPLGSTGPCCTATKLSAISMLYFDNNNNIILGKLPGMTVDRCGCS